MNPSPDPSDTDAHAAADELAPGTTLLHRQYVIESFLSSGGFGITYLARDSLDRQVVIKECFPRAFCRRDGSAVVARSRVPQEDFRRIVHLFVQEARNLAKLRHPNIVGVHQVFEDNDTAYMALDYVPGRELLDIIEERTLLRTSGEITALLATLLDTIEFIHSQGVLHRDISPDNILIQDDGSPVLIDFGAARASAMISDRARTALLAVKDGYSPQEFYVTGTPQGPSSDLYALAATFYHLLAGEAPPPSQDRLAAVAEKRADPLVPAAQRVTGYDTRFLEAMDRVLAVFPKDRFQSAGDWKAYLRAPREPSPDVSLSLALARRREALTSAADGRRSKPRPASLIPKTPHLKVVTAVPEVPATAGSLLPETPVHALSDTPVAASPERLELREDQRYPAPTETDDEPRPNETRAPLATPAPPARTGMRRFMLAGAGAAVIGAVALTAVFLGGAPAPEAELSAAAVVADAPSIPVGEAPSADGEVPRPDPVEAAPQAVPADPPVLAAAAPETPPDASPPPASAPSPARVEPEPAETAPFVSATVPEIATGEDGGRFDAAVSVEADAVPPRYLTELSAPSSDTAPRLATNAPTLPVDPAERPAAEDAIVRDASPVMAGWTADLPFTVTGPGATIAATRSDAPAGIRTGARILALNGEPVSSLSEIRSGFAAMGEPGADGTWQAAFAMRTPGGGGDDIVTVRVPAARQVALLNGVRFEATPFDGGWRTVVTQSPFAGVDELLAGDVVIAYLATGETVDGPDSLSALLERELAQGVSAFNLAVRRNRDLWAVTMDYAAGNRN